MTMSEFENTQFNCQSLRSSDNDNSNSNGSINNNTNANNPGYSQKNSQSSTILDDNIDNFKESSWSNWNNWN